MSNKIISSIKRSSINGVLSVKFEVETDLGSGLEKLREAEESRVWGVCKHPRASREQGDEKARMGSGMVWERDEKDGDGAGDRRPP